MSSVLTSSQPDLQGDDTGTFGTFELHAIFNGDKPLDTIQLALAIEFLGRSEIIHVERLQCIADGATLAAEQVQDVRLDLIEQGPEVSTQAVIIDLFVGLLLDSSLPGKIMKGFASAISKRMVRRYQLLLEGERSKAANILKNPKLLNSLYASGPMRKQNIAIIEKVLDKELKADEYLKAADRWRGLVTYASNSDRVKNVTAFMKAGHRLSKTKRDTKPLRIDGDTPGVSLLGSIQEYMANSRIVIRFQYTRMETVLKISGMTGAEARSFLKLAEFDPVDADSLKGIRDRCKLLFEALIWAGLFRFDPNNRKLRANPDRLQGIDKRLADYWIKRFGDDIEGWIKGMDQYGLRNEGQNPIESWNKITYIEKLGALERYFIKLLRDLPRALDDARALTSNFKSE